MFQQRHPIVLEGSLVCLEPLGEKHFSELIRAGADPRIWTNLPIDGSDGARLQAELRNALLHRAAGTQYPFVIMDKATGRLIGSTRFLDIFPEHQKLEIGWTWYTPGVWGKGHNLDCKLLLLSYSFEVLRLNRVQLKTRDTNLRSQGAIQKIGGVFEGILRRDRVMPDGQVRDTVVFSLIREEWTAARESLQQKLAVFLPA